MVRKNIYEEDYPPWADVKEKLFTRTRQGYLDEKLLNKLSMMQHVIIDRYFIFFYHIMLPLFNTYLFWNPGGQTEYLLFYGREMLKSIYLSDWYLRIIWPWFKPENIAGIVCHDGYIVRDYAQDVNSGAIYCLWNMGDYYTYDIVQGMNYWLWIPIKRVKNSALLIQQQRNYRMVKIRATKLIKYGDDLIRTPNFSQSIPNLLYVRMRKFGKHQVMVKRVTV